MPWTDKLEQRMSTIQSNLKSPTHTPFGSKLDLEKCTSVTFDVLCRILVSVAFKVSTPPQKIAFIQSTRKLQD